MSTPTETLLLNCFVEGDPSYQTFSVKILKTEDVSHLKDLIKEKKSNRFKHRAASALQVFAVSESFSIDDLDSKQPPIGGELMSYKTLSSLFPSDISGDDIHIYVKKPPGISSGTKDVEEERRDSIAALDKRFKNLISHILKASAANASNYIKSQVASTIYDGRYKANNPRTSIAPPVQLYHPAFGHFLDIVKSNHTPPDEIIRQTIDYMKAASAIYESEEKRRRVLTPLLCDILDVNIHSILNEDETSSDCMVKNLLSLIFLKDDKNGVGDGSFDPSSQAGLSAGRCWAQSKYLRFRNATACPTFLLATNGPWLTILGAVIIDGVIVQRLTNYIFVGLNSVLNESHITDVARVFSALKTSLKRLVDYYKTLEPSSNRPIGSRYFPSITAYHGQDNALIEFEYVGYLENGPDCVILRARTLAKQQDIVVKFVDRYGVRAHQLLANNDLAPKLLFCGSPCFDEDQPSYQSISMVVMEYINGDTLAVAKVKMDDEERTRVRSEVCRALKLLHDQELVFGDLRPPNIMITKDRQVKLIDFDFAGDEGQAKYPFLISTIGWPNGVEALAIIKQEHDMVMLERLF